MGALLIEAPSLTDYERGLPEGWSSFPGCQAKASLLRATASDPMLPDCELPDEVRQLLDDPPPVTAWIPEVMHVAVSLAVHEAYVRAGRSQAFFTWIEEKNRELLGSVTYAPIMRTPGGWERALKALAPGWERFHRGTSLAIDRHDEGSACLVLTSPPGLYPGIAAQMHGVSLRVALEAALGGEVRVRHVMRRPGLTEYQLEWSD